MLRYHSAPTEKTNGWENEVLFSFVARGMRSQSGSDSRALSTATQSVVRGLIAAAAGRKNVSQQGDL